MGFNSLVVVFISERWLLPTTTDQCSYNIDHEVVTSYSISWKLSYVAVTGPRYGKVWPHHWIMQ